MSNYRRYNNIDEFPFMVGEVITFRLKKGADIKTSLLVEIEINERTKRVISYNLGSRMYTNAELFDWFEYLDPIDNQWKPFGVER